MSAIIDAIVNQYSRYYDIKELPSFMPTDLDIYAHFYQSNERYFASKKINIWRMDQEEHCFVKRYNKLAKEDVVKMIELLKMGVDKLIQPSSDHMKTYLTGVLVAEEALEPELAKYIQKFKYAKAFKFYLHGWADIRLIVLDLDTSRVYLNKTGQEVEKFYYNLLEKIGSKK